MKHVVHSGQVENIPVDDINLNKHIVVRVVSILNPEILACLENGGYCWFNIKNRKAHDNSPLYETLIEESLELMYPVYVFESEHEYLEELLNLLDM